MGQLNSVDILLVEDNQYDAELIVRELRKSNLTNNLFQAEDGEDALNFIYAKGKYAGVRDASNPPKVIFLDIQMPKVNGLEVLQRLKGDPVMRTIPVVILTSSKENRDIKRCYELGANSFVVKPVDFADFSTAIKNMCFYWLFLNQPHH